MDLRSEENGGSCRWDTDDDDSQLEDDWFSSSSISLPTAKLLSDVRDFSIFFVPISPSIMSHVVAIAWEMAVGDARCRHSH